MTIQSKVSDGSAVVEMAGTMAARDFSALHQCLLNLLRTRRTRIVLDFRAVEHVNYLDARRLALMLDVVRSYNAELAVAGMSPYLRDIFTFAGLGAVLDACTVYQGIVGEQEPAH